MEGQQLYEFLSSYGGAHLLGFATWWAMYFQKHIFRFMLKEEYPFLYGGRGQTIQETQSNPDSCCMDGPVRIGMLALGFIASVKSLETGNFWWTQFLFLPNLMNILEVSIGWANSKKVDKNKN
ncbi:hypothetical protein A2767_00665 [Candidatus Roizmanbacteria bacterium RIFCSPHIGHO2_01_FULL_35_10]|uniref:Uncharacterized protein n=1 Tax=Candidatus Roizmanbacteria bacterium RIFCSPLOWO2_01_FULL_35_13 TaxID=1802055 RepID=A0A1F7I907_9BACT|nr:MAG: hypothetical protein A2767_00665 [Candidatus Roizmanbacteria bacterium RIFCSPHIGHO2_01_FULL_35_10]OGK39851.1 MAG: hypothetical protein A3A74_03090 [Candidatus Roizmanbacteria bacterium RIFCSPLOWO2_01_FULL_35_13]